MSAKTPTRDIFVAAEPRVQLLPPSVRLREKNRRTRRLLVLLIVLSLTVVAGGLSFGYYRAIESRLALEAAQARTADLLQQQAAYADASRIAGLVVATGDAQKLLTSGEVDWAAVMADLESYLPAQAAIAGATLTAPAPWEPPLVPEGPLRAERVATITLVIESSDYDMAARFIAAVQADESVADARIMSSAKEGSTYLTTVSLTLNDTVLLTRFDDTDDPEPDPSESEEPDEGEPDESDPEGGTPAPTPTPTATEGTDQ
jgi:hypothetical protein